MNDIKTFLIGFLACACLFLIMGQTKNEGGGKEWEKKVRKMKDAGINPLPNLVGRYQAISGNKYEYFYLLDTG